MRTSVSPSPAAPLATAALDLSLLKNTVLFRLAGAGLHARVAEAGEESSSAGAAEDDEAPLIC